MGVLDPETPILVAEAGFFRLNQLRGLLGEFYLQNLTTTGRGSRAIEMARRVDFKLIIVSDSLVNMHGIDVIEAIRQKGKNTDTPIFFLVEPYETMSRSRAFDLSVVHILEKPLKENELREALEMTTGEQVVSKLDEEKRVKTSMLPLHEAVAFAKSLRVSEDYNVAETEFCNGLTEVFCGLAEVYLSKGDKNSAAYVIEKAEQLDADARERFGVREDSFVTQGRAYLREKRYLAAKAEFKAALTLNEESFPALVGLGTACFYNGEKKEGRELFEKVMGLYAEGLHAEEIEPKFFKEMGLAACRAQDYSLAQSVLDRAIRFFPDDANLYYYKAVAAIAGGDTGDAEPLLKRALHLSPKFVEAIALLKKTEEWCGAAGKKEKKTLAEMNLH